MRRVSQLNGGYRALPRLLVAALCAIAAAAPPASAQIDAGGVARALGSDPVYVHPRVTRRLPPRAQGRIRLAIVREAIGRIKVAVVPPDVARTEGSVAGFATAVDRTIDVPGALIVVADDVFVITSHPRSDATASAVREGFSSGGSGGLAAQLLDAFPRIAAVDPGPAADIGPPALQAPAGGGVPAPDPDGFTEDIGDAFRLGVLIVAAAIALPFLLVALYLVLRYRRRRATEEEVTESGEQKARERLLGLGEGIRSLDLDSSLPDADRGGLADLEQAIARYDEANSLLLGDPSPHRVQQARATIESGERHIESARQRLS